MNCNACQEQLCLMLDGTEMADGAALDRHLHDCADCRAYHDAARRLQLGLKLLRPPTPPALLTSRIVAAVHEEGRRSRRRVRLRMALSLAVAASVLIGVAVRLWPGRPTLPTTEAGTELVGPAVPDRLAPDTKPPTPEVATPRRSMETAVEAVASLTTRTTSQTVEETRRLMPLVEQTLPDLVWEPTLPTLSLGNTGHGVSEGLEPVATHAKRAVGLLRRDLLPDF